LILSHIGQLDEDITYANAQTLTMGDSMPLSVLPESYAGIIKFLRKLIEKGIGGFLDVLTGEELTLLEKILKAGGESTLEDLINGLLSTVIKFETTSHNEVTVIINGSQGTSPFDTHLKFEYNNEGERLFLDQFPLKNRPFQVTPGFAENEGDDLDVRVLGEGKSTAFARGPRGGGVSGVLSLWGFTVMQCCQAQGEQTHHKKWAWTRDQQHFAVESDTADFLRGFGFAKYLFKFNKVRVQYVDIFDTATLEAEDLLKKDQCGAAKKVLQQMQRDLRNLLNSVKGSNS
jgi:hypothetical protein